jgi:hypothetical protein
MRVRHLVLAAVAAVAAVSPARAALVLDYVLVPAITSGATPGAALNGTTLTLVPGTDVFLQIALRDTTGAGPNGGQPPGTVPWQTNGGAGGAGSLILGAFFVQFDSVPGVAVNPSPTSNLNARLVGGDYASLTAGTNPPTFTRFGGLIQGGSESDVATVPDPLNQNRIALFNLRISALAPGSGTFHLRDPNPTPASADNATLANSNPGNNDGTLATIDDLLFGPAFTNTFDLNVVVTPEPTSLALCGMALAGLGYRKLRRKKVSA